MQDRLYPLKAKDIEAIGKSRASRSMPQNVKWWMYGGGGVCVAGFIYGAMGDKNWFAIGLIVVGVGCVYYSSVLVDRIRKIIIRQLKQDWRDEQGKESR